MRHPAPLAVLLAASAALAAPSPARAGSSAASTLSSAHRASPRASATHARVTTPAATAALSGSVDPNDPQSWRFELALEQAAPLRLTCDEAGESRERHLRRSGSSTHHALTIRGLKAATRYTCRAEVLDGSRRVSTPVSFITAPLPPDLKAPVPTP